MAGDLGTLILGTLFRYPYLSTLPDLGTLLFPIVPYSAVLFHSSQDLKSYFITYSSEFKQFFNLIIYFAVKSFFCRPDQYWKYGEFCPLVLNYLKFEHLSSEFLIAKGPLVTGSGYKNGEAISGCDTVWETAESFFYLPCFVGGLHSLSLFFSLFHLCIFRFCQQTVFV